MSVFAPTFNTKTATAKKAKAKAKPKVKAVKRQTRSCAGK